MNGTRETSFVRCCLEGLERMYLPGEGLFAFSLRLRDGSIARERSPLKEVKFTLNALLGLRRAREAGYEVFLDVERACDDLMRWAAGSPRAGSPAAPAHRFAADPENLAALAWTGLALGVPLPGPVRRQWEAALDEGMSSGSLTAQALAWGIAAGTCDGEAGRARARKLAEQAAARYVHADSSLVRHAPIGLRRSWASFAASCYMAWALLTLARTDDSGWARSVGLRTAHALVRLQGPRGQWGWLYHVPRGVVVDYYPVYSVHQHAMAPFFLLEAIDQGCSEFRAPLVLGFRWVLGQNEPGVSMVEPDMRLIWRSVVRRTDQGRLSRFAGALGASMARRRATECSVDRLDVNRECRSYELAWGLYAFAGRQDFPEILDHEAFATGKRAA